MTAWCWHAPVEADDMVTPEPTHLYRMYAPAVIGLETTGSEGTVSMATAFHIGDGFLLTARHVLEGRSITDVVTHSYARMGVIHSIRYPSDSTVDLALLSSDFNLDHYMSDRVTIVGFSRDPPVRLVCGWGLVARRMPSDLG
jgi:hypothetical protein